MLTEWGSLHKPLGGHQHQPFRSRPSESLRLPGTAAHASERIQGEGCGPLLCSENSKETHSQGRLLLFTFCAWFLQPVLRTWTSNYSYRDRRAWRLQDKQTDYKSERVGARYFWEWIHTRNLDVQILWWASRCPLLWWDGAGRRSPKLLAWVGKSASRAGRNPRLRVPPSSPVRALHLSGAAAWDYCSGVAESLLGIWHVITSGPLASCSWLGHMKAQTVPASELKRTNTISIPLTTMNATYSNEEYQEDTYRSQTGMCTFWGMVEYPTYLCDLWRQLRRSYNRAVADTQLITHLLQPCGWQGLGAPAGCQAWVWGGRAEFRTLVHQRPPSPT